MAASRDDIKFLSNPNIGKNRSKYCRFRKFGIKYAALHPQTVEVRNAFIRVRRPEDWLTVLDRWYTEDLPGQYPPADLHRENACG